MSTSCKDVFVGITRVVAVPSAFTPNKDNTNDILKVKGGPFSQMEFQIFNRWGNLIFSSQSQEIGWDGTFNGDLQPAGVYEYILNALTLDNKNISIYGLLTLHAKIMTMKKLLHLFLINFLILSVSYAQDSHFSQFDANPFYINPALLGERLFDNKGIQVNASYRDQQSRFSGATSSYKNVAIGIDEPLSSKFAVGQFFYNDKSATGSFKTTGFLLAGAYKLIDQSVDGNENQNLSVGIQIGGYNKSIHPDQFTYDTQYSVNSSDGFDRTIASGETYERQNYFDYHLNFGIYYRSTSKNKKNTIFGGLALYNITQSNKSFLTGFSPLPLRFNLHAGAICTLTKLLSVMPQVLYMNQADATELNIGMLMFYKIEGTLYEPILGLSFRNKDAVIFQLGLKYQGITFRASYDIVTNPTKVYRNRGLELSFIYTLKKKSPKAKKQEAQNMETPAPVIETAQ